MKQTKKVSSFRSFLTFTSHLIHYCYVLRGMLGMQLLMVVLGGSRLSPCARASPSIKVFTSR